MEKKAIRYLIVLLVVFVVLVVLTMCTVEKNSINFTGDTLFGTLLGIVFSLLIFIAVCIYPAMSPYAEKEVKRQEEKNN